MSEWISVDDELPEYYTPVWTTDGVTVRVGEIVGRSYTPSRKYWRNCERAGVVELFRVKFWKEFVRPEPPQSS
ncbi:MAG: DUF551 domain-containing protein [Candidatus Thiodiazotropha taylori]|uniref:DUF551 domain-containing protein n=1 Tax=Candidatus Thiodiazotropha taylori TaxID=2792791 RepID=A0A9E4T443_9GAMM|nr:DUF551 domain-containing protein [Candidatus Thiodiazotropha taylori]MCW4258186.1 DUF551 domain-containing protein [Candidatus Thiodiazotropha taylori]